jgi:hypothetical protein
MSLRADFMAQKRLDEEEKEIKTTNQLKTENEILEKDKANLAVITETLKVQFKQLKQTLVEIKEIAYELTNEEYTDFIESKQKQILQKISECEVDNDL